MRLLEDVGPRPVGLPVPYKVPVAGDDQISIPAAFFLNGWVFTLADSEIVTYLMYRMLCRGGRGARISAAEREDFFGVKTSAWEQYWLLEACGLVQVEPGEGRRSDGTFVGQARGAEPTNHVFRMRDETLNDGALTKVWGVVDARVDRKKA